MISIAGQSGAGHVIRNTVLFMILMRRLNVHVATKGFVRIILVPAILPRVILAGKITAKLTAATLANTSNVSIAEQLTNWVQVMTAGVNIPLAIIAENHPVSM